MYILPKLPVLLAKVFLFLDKLIFEILLNESSTLFSNSLFFVKFSSSLQDWKMVVSPIRIKLIVIKANIPFLKVLNFSY